MPNATLEQATSMFPIVGMGGSAGGLQAFQEVLSNLPIDTGMGFVLVSHLDPTQESLLASILSRSTTMPTAEVEDGVVVEPNHVYVLPPNAGVVLKDGALRLVPRDGLRHECIDYFLTTLAEERGNCAVAVILSGTAADGAEGCRAVKAAGGITFAQDEGSAKFSQMPRNAVATGCIDLVATPRGIAEELVAVSKCSYVRRPTLEPDQEEVEDEAEDGPLQVLFRMLRGGTGIDFARYKQNTVRRRIARRMAVRRLERLEDYVRYLEDHPPELGALHDELLINVTAFFRDPELFKTLAERVFPALTEGRAQDEPLRVWVAGCSTGEEAYSIAIAFLEFVQQRHLTLSMQMFATDVSERAIARARAGVYGDGIRASVSERRLRRYFTRSSTGAFQVAPQVRDLCVFARHDVTRDPPFSRLDLVSCRNVLIYMDSSLQRRVLPMFHYALRPKGFLALGSSESADRFPALFAPVENGYHLFAKVPGGGRPELGPAGAERAPHPHGAAGKKSLDNKHDDLRPSSDVDVAREADRLLLTTYVPTGIVVDERGHIVHFRGDTSRYLKVPSGPASFRLTSMVREELFLPLEGALREARERDQPVRRERVVMRGANGEPLDVNLEVIPLRGQDGPSGHLVVVFEGAREATASDATPRAPDDELTRMRAELEASRRHQAAVIEKLEGMNEELRSANEEVLSSNEELQSANEELETAKEELQSGNEELNTINDELQSRNGELAQVAGDLQNLVAGIDIAIAIVDSSLRLRRFTPATARLLHVIPSDVGRPITDFKLDLDLPSLEPMIRQVMTTLETTDTEVRDADHRWYSMRMRPYRTPDDRIDGVVIVWLDIEAMKQGLHAVKHAQALTEGIVETVRDPLLVLDGALRVQRANQAFYETFGETHATTEGRDLHELLGGRLEAPGLRALLKGVAADGVAFSDFEVDRTFERLGRRITLLHARLLRKGGDREPLVLLALEDVTSRRVRERFSKSLEGLSRELDYAATLENVTRLVVDSLCDWCCILVREPDGSVRRAATLHRDATRTKELDADLEQHPLPLDLDCCWPRSLRTGQPEVRAALPDVHALRWLRALGVTSTLCVPLLVRGTVRGVIWMSADQGGRRFGPEDLALAEELARHAALALDNARLYAEAHQTIRERERFVSIASHELRTPLQGLQLQVQLLRRVVPAIPGDKLDRLDRQCLRLAELLDALLDVARIRTDHLDLRPEEVDLTATARSVVARLAEDAQTRGILLRLDAPLPVKGLWDGLRLEQVVTNLVTNAIKYGRNQPVDVQVNGDEWQAFLRVQDRGIGMSSEERASLFRPYERVGSREQPGLGLGLFIVNEIVAAHGGTVTVESQLDAGSTFTVALPRAVPPPVGAASAPTSASAPMSLSPTTRTVTIADDGPAVASVERPST